MKSHKFRVIFSLSTLLLVFSFLHAEEKDLPEEMQKIIHQSKYDHSIWGIYAKDIQTGKVLFDLNSEKFFLPASTTKLLSIAALLHTFGDDYRFKTPIIAVGTIKNGVLSGNLILVGQGDMTLGGRQPNADQITYTKLDHNLANVVPGVVLTNEDPLKGIKELAKQVYENGIREIHGNVLIKDTLFETTEKSGVVISPIMINENILDFVINPTELGEKATLTWRPEVPGYTVDNQITTVATDGPLEIEVTADAPGNKILLQGTIPLDQKDIVRILPIKDPKSFARKALVHALETQGIKMHLPQEKSAFDLDANTSRSVRQVALLTSPPLSAYAKLILKVSHNLGADLVPLLLAAHKGKKTFEEGMRLLGDFAIKKVKLSPDAFVLVDASGGNENRLSPQAEVKLLEFIHKGTVTQFRHFFDALPILGIDGSLADFGKETEAAGKVRGKTGTSISTNLATGRLFLNSQALAGYIEGKNGHLFAYMIVVNNAKMPTINDVFPIFEDLGQLSNMTYNYSHIGK